MWHSRTFHGMSVGGHGVTSRIFMSYLPYLSYLPDGSTRRESDSEILMRSHGASARLRVVRYRHADRVLLKPRSRQTQVVHTGPAWNRADGGGGFDTARTRTRCGAGDGHGHT